MIKPNAVSPDVAALKLDTILLVEVLYVSFSFCEIWLPAEMDLSISYRQDKRNELSDVCAHSAKCCAITKHVR